MNYDHAVRSARLADEYEAPVSDLTARTLCIAWQSPDRHALAAVASGAWRPRDLRRPSMLVDGDPRSTLADEFRADVARTVDDDLVCRTLIRWATAREDDKVAA